MIGGTENEQYEAMKPCNWSGMAMEGSSRDVVALTLALDIGDISDMDTDMDKRKKLFESLFVDFPGVSDEMWKINQHTLMRLQEAKTSLEPIRMWISTSDPAEMCSLYFVCHLMSDSQTPLSVVCVPQLLEKDNRIICYRSTGEVHAEEFGALTEYEEPISELQRRVYAGIWCDLMSENAPLRAIVNGCVIGVPVDFYDFSLRSNLSDGEIKVAQLIGKTLSQIPGVGDRWLFLRIRAMIESGELIEISMGTGDHPYSGVVKRRNKM
ncbi:DUF3658 domain-containing protein [Lachnoclostridium sp.]|uniref:DUF3658 domain-containing protein n=1 Tax=Lachnoclostridium sp. TaxID=2028282 RepID=UPI00289CB02D|nr:DUF3658 domain-containing protein [Lachnoclostridium sp.]